ncbi:DUF4437 domain-containing protein [Herbaspirillum robiniae]|uniref:Cupin domain-containing protein n=1 Tax=Herbaspirillum robiniae TaxID=2014887 RepID=A0ABX2M0M8_9BURK|nr:DUF4437 domain-containing protein [Herbaspirillum robiniae]NUU03548.1 cupin domain-containing protein [Herbaspirillum robiniae]
MHRITAIALITAALGAAFAPTVQAAQAGEHPHEAAPRPLVSFPAAQLTWRELPGTGGIQVADVRGSLTGKGAYEAFVIFPAGKDNPYHLHTRNLPTVVIRGSFYTVIDGKRTDHPAGSFYNLPAGMPHYSGCAKGEDCLLFQYQSDHFDMVPVDGK